MSRTPDRTPVPILEEVQVRTVRRLSPSFVRVELGGAALAGLRVDGPLWDQRVKLVLPAADGSLPTLDATDPDWYARWAALPARRRGHLRTYTVREVRGGGAQTRLVVDMVVRHGAPAGPGSRWAESARAGDRLLLLAPRRGVRFGGAEFAPGRARTLLLAGDETAVPAIAAILEQLPSGVSGDAFLEVPDAADVQALIAPDRFSVTWLPRATEPHGRLLTHAVLSLFGLEMSDRAVGGRTNAPAEDREGPPQRASAGQRKPAAGAEAEPGRYAWVAGESGTVRALRRRLLADAGFTRRQVTALGYWHLSAGNRS